MNERLVLWFGMAVVCAILISGCAEQTQHEGNIITQTGNEKNSVGSNGTHPFGYTSKWPEYIPEDIPELEGEIDIVMAAETHIRIFYKNLDERQVYKYLDQLEKEGFHLKYIVYENPWSDPEDIATRIKRGEWDAVDITKDDYRMRLEYGGDFTTYDIDKTWLEQEAEMAAVLQWPQERFGTAA